MSMKPNSSPGPDGISLEFYKVHWELVKHNFMTIVRDFFDGRCLIKHLNAIFITLIPKSKEASPISQFQPISCTNVSYKAISKVLATRLAHHFPLLISLNHFAFVKGRVILDNSSLVEVLLRGFEENATR